VRCVGHDQVAGLLREHPCWGGGGVAQGPDGPGVGARDPGGPAVPGQRAVPAARRAARRRGRRPMPRDGVEVHCHGSRAPAAARHHAHHLSQG